MKKGFALVLSALLVLAMVACGGGNGDTSTPTTEPETQATQSDAGDSTDPEPAPEITATDKKVGVSMPTQSLQRWNQDGANMKTQLESAGYEVDLQYAGDDVPTQVSQIENMIAGGCSVLVIAPIDDSTLTSVLSGAKEKNIPVIAYDRLIKDTDAVTYYASFDNWKVGTMQGQFIVDMLDLENEDGPFNIELFTGSPDDNNVNFFFGGAMEVLQPYIDAGKLVVPSGQTSKEQCATMGWSTEESQKRMENLISSQGYSPTGTQLDAVLSSNDSVANGITNALVNAGYTAEDFPVLTGQDCDITSMKNMLAGTQGMSVFKDTRTLAAQVVKMVESIMGGTEPEMNDHESYDNGTGIIPSFLCDPVVCTLENYEDLLIDSGYYSEDELR